jgi:predicted nucleic acid-binding protein
VAIAPSGDIAVLALLALLADRGRRRAPSIPDLIIAATAGLAGLTVLHLGLMRICRQEDKGRRRPFALVTRCQGALENE